MTPTPKNSNLVKEEIDKLRDRKKEIDKILYNPANRRSNGKPIAEVAPLQVERAKIQIRIYELQMVNKLI